MTSFSEVTDWSIRQMKPSAFSGVAVQPSQPEAEITKPELGQNFFWGNFSKINQLTSRQRMEHELKLFGILENWMTTDYGLIVSPRIVNLRRQELEEMMANEE
eukprot:c13874_g1_i2.p1 GENE.c13874_g1_i2~~c13874_g1_i2.p1  ORF type:complete len:103 (+),score=20.06 c13874_g1_i2:472-780(+)